MILFYAPDITVEPILPEAESGHCVRVLRKKEDDIIDITDGKGFFYRGRILEAHPKRCLIEIVQTLKPTYEQGYRVELAVAPTKNIDRMEWLAEKATEIGIDRITFLRTHHSERKEIKPERIKKILVSAMKQSEKATLPEAEGMIDFNRFVKTAFQGRKFIAHCYEDEKTVLSRSYQPGENALILIGPEGDFSKEEIELALSQGFEPVSLGESRLRTETAALAACQTIHIINQLA